jgi:hypothetical protein
MLPVVIVYKADRRNAAERLERRLRALGFEVLLQMAEQSLPDDYLAVIAINAAELPRRALPDDTIELTATSNDYDFVVRQLVRRLYARLPPTSRRSRSMSQSDEEETRGTTRGIKPSESRPVSTEPRPPALSREFQEPPAEAPEAVAEAPSPEAYAEPPIAEARFTAFLPRHAAVERWHSLLVYAHTPAMSDQIRADARRFAPELGDTPRQVSAAESAALARGTRLTFTPYAPDVLFNPESITLAWWEDLHRLEFRFKAAAALRDQAVNLTITVSADPLVIATLRGGIVFEAPESAYASNPFENEPITTAPYRAEEIFVSYSHRDSDVVEACRNAYRALGYKVLMDIDELRSGELWNARLKDFIERATIFQLFWSENAAKSEFCRQEWQHALGVARRRGSDGAGFIRPVYWRKPLVTPPQELSHLHFAYVPLPRLAE